MCLEQMLTLHASSRCHVTLICIFCRFPRPSLQATLKIWGHWKFESVRFQVRTAFVSRQIAEVVFSAWSTWCVSC